MWSGHEGGKCNKAALNAQAVVSVTKSLGRLFPKAQDETKKEH